MTGAAAQELGNKEQALAAFQRAIQISPNQAPAWQVTYKSLLENLEIYVILYFFLFIRDSLNYMRNPACNLNSLVFIAN